MIFEINPNYNTALAIDFNERVLKYYLLYANRKDIIVDDEDVLEDDCLIAYSDKSRDEVINHRSSLIKSGYYKPTELYIREMPNFVRRK